MLHCTRPPKDSNVTGHTDVVWVGLASAAAERALAIDPDLPEAHTSLAFIKVSNDWNWAEAEREFRHALDLDGTQTLARLYLSCLTEAIEVGQRTVLMSDRAPFYLGVLGHYHARNGAIGERVVAMQRLSKGQTAARPLRLRFGRFPRRLGSS